MGNVGASAPPAGRFQFRLLGPFTVFRDGERLSEREVGSRQGRTLLKLLLLERGRAVSSDRIAEVLWPDAPPARWERDLATLVSRLRAVFGADAIAGGPTGYRFAPSARFEVDLADAERLTAEAESRLGSGESSLGRAAAEQALRLLGNGTLLEDEPYAEWADQARAAVATLLRRARRCGWRAAAALSDFEGAVRVAEAAASADPLDEEAHRELMLAHGRAGQPARALEAYERLRETLAEQLGTDPAPETRALHQAILRERIPPALEEAEGGPAPPPALDPSFVGRDAEVARLSRDWGEAVAGRPSLVVISGEAGIGKTMLAGEVLGLAEATGGKIAQSRCYEAERSLFLQPVVDAIRSAILSMPPEAVREVAGDWAGTLAELVPEIERILRPIRYERSSPDMERRRTFEAVTAFFRSLAERRPLLLFLDDLQNAGSSTRELLHFIGRRAAGARLLVLATIRAEEGEEALAQLEGVGQRLELGPLPEAAVSELARRSGAVELSGRILAMTRGHPLFVVEILRSLAEGGGGPGEAPLPDSLLEAVLARVRRSGQEVEQLLRAAATLGSTFGLNAVAELLDLPTEEAARRAESARRARLLTEAGADFEFANDLVGEILYRTTPLPTRTARHRRAAVFLAGNPEAVATHAAAAGDWPAALEAWLQAGERAAAKYANRDAESMLGQALHAASMAGDPAGEARARLARGQAREALTDFQGSYEDFWAAIERARAGGAREIEMRALGRLGGDTLVGLGRPTAECLPYLDAALAIAVDVGDVPLQVDALSRLAIIWSNRLRFDLAFEHGRRAVDLARGAGDDSVLGAALDGLKTAAAYSGDLATLEALLPELQGILRRQGELWRLPWALFESSFLPMARGQWDRAARRIEEALELTRRSGGFRQNLPMFVAHQGWIERSRGELGQALESGRRAVELAEDVRHPWMTAAAGVLLGGLMIELHSLDLAVPYLDRALRAAERDGAESYLVRCLGLSAVAAQLQGHADRATRFLERAEAIIGRVSTPTGTAFLHGAEAYLAVARVRLELGDPQGAGRVAEALLEEAQTAGWKEAAGRAAVLAGRSRMAAGDAEGADRLFRRALETSDQATLPFPAWQAHAGLAALEAGGRTAEDSARHVADALAIVDSLARTIPDDQIRRGYEAGVRGELQAIAAPAIVRCGPGRPIRPQVGSGSP